MFPARPFAATGRAKLMDRNFIGSHLAHILQLMYFMLPAYLANMTPPFVRFWRGWNRPISRRWLGDHKTVVGFISGMIVALAVACLQSKFHWRHDLLPYNHWPTLGLAFGFGAMSGDSLKSLFKRFCKIRPGQPWIPMDQLDFVVGALLLVSPWAPVTWVDVLIILVISFAGDIAINHLSYALSIRNTRW